MSDGLSVIYLYVCWSICYLLVHVRWSVCYLLVFLWSVCSLLECLLVCLSDDCLSEDDVRWCAIAITYFAHHAVVQLNIFQNGFLTLRCTGCNTLIQFFLYKICWNGHSRYFVRICCSIPILFIFTYIYIMFIDGHTKMPEEMSTCFNRFYVKPGGIEWESLQL